MSKYWLYFLLGLLLLLVSQEVKSIGMGMGMGMGPPGGPCGSPPWPPCAVPLDGGIGILAGAGAVYSYFKISKRNKKNPA